MCAGDCNGCSFKEGCINADHVLTFFGFCRNFVRPILGGAVVGPDEELCQCWDAVWKCLRYLREHCCFFELRNGCCKLKDNDYELHHIDMDVILFDALASFGGPVHVEPKLEFMAVCSPSDEACIPKTCELSIPWDDMANVHLPEVCLVCQ